MTINTGKDVTKDIADDKHSKILSDDEVRASIIDPLAGGTFPVANSFCLIVYFLARHPEVHLQLAINNNTNSWITCRSI